MNMNVNFPPSLTDGSHWETAPFTNERLTTGSILGVHVPPGKSVRWTITKNSDGTEAVTGYEFEGIKENKANA